MPLSKVAKTLVFLTTPQDPNIAFINKLADISAKNLTDKNGDTIDSQSILAIINQNIDDSAYWADMMTMSL